MGISFLWEPHGKRPMGWDRHKLLWDGNGTDKYVPWTTLQISSLATTCIGQSLLTFRSQPEQYWIFALIVAALN